MPTPLQQRLRCPADDAAVHEFARLFPQCSDGETLKVIVLRRCAAAAPMVSLTDDGHKLVPSRPGSRLRVAGTCELNGYSRELNPVRCKAITHRVREVSGPIPKMSLTVPTFPFTNQRHG